MEIKYKNPVELKDKFLPELVEIFDTSNIDDLKTDVEENGILNPITLAKDGSVLDGMRRINVAIKLGLNEIPVVMTDLEATPENRIALNNVREMTWKDLRNLFILLFQIFAKRQGMRASKYFDRYVEINKRTKNRFKDNETLKSVEYILTNDIAGFPFSKLLFEINCDVKPIKNLMEVMLSGGHDEIVDQVIKMEISPKEALRLINEEAAEEELKKQIFSLPPSKGIEAVIHQGDPAELLSMIKKETVQALFYTPDTYTSTINDDSSNYKKMMHHDPKVYALKMVDPIRAWIDRLPMEANVFVTTHEHYKDGYSLQIPANLIQAITDETKLVFKQTLFVTGDQTFSADRDGKNLSDSVTQILWFVKDRIEAVKNLHQPSFEINNEAVVNSKTYKFCSNFLDQQVIENVIVAKGFVVNKNSTPNYAALVPILSTTVVDDLVVDISMKNDIGTIALMSNRRFIGISPSKVTYDKEAKALINAVKEFSGEAKAAKSSKSTSKKMQPSRVAA